MKIVFLTRYFWPHVGGVERHVEAVGQKLGQLGHEVTVITLKHEAKLAESQTYQGLKIIRLPDSNSKIELWWSLWQKRVWLKAADIIHCHDIFFWYLPFRLIWPNKPVFTTFHGWEGVWPIPRRYRWMHRMAEKLSRGSICVGDYLIKWYGHKPDYVTYGGITLSWYDRGIKTFTPKIKEIIFIGRLEADLGLPEYFKALKIIKKQYHLPITFVGDGRLKRAAAKFGRVVGNVTDLRPYLNRPAAILASSYLTIWEALAYGRPVFALYQNPLKKDYLEKFPAARAINISASAGEFLRQLETVKKAQLPIHRLIGNSWRQVAKIYLKLWQK